MKTLKFSIHIHASAQKVWRSLWDLENYKLWTTPFCDGCYYKTDKFYEGNTIHLLSPGGEGMYSILEKIEENKYLAFKHIGALKNFEEVTISDEVLNWTGALETYTLNKITEENTELLVHVDTFEKYVDFMHNTFPKALQKLKELAEN